MGGFVTSSIWRAYKLSFEYVCKSLAIFNYMGPFLTNIATSSTTIIIPSQRNPLVSDTNELTSLAKLRKMCCVRLNSANESNQGNQTALSDNLLRGEELECSHSSDLKSLHILALQGSLETSNVWGFEACHRCFATWSLNPAQWLDN